MSGPREMNKLFASFRANDGGRVRFLCREERISRARGIYFGADNVLRLALRIRVRLTLAGSRNLVAS